MAAIDEAVTKEAIKRDIDGLPLKDNQRVDLKTILGHSPPVDDDDPEAEGSGRRSLRLEDFTIEENNADDDDDDGLDEDANNCLGLRQRRSSLRTQQQQSGDRPDSPTGERKGVRFADSLGIGLAAIRDVGDDDEPPEIPHSALNALRIRRRRGLQAQRGKVVVLVPAFETPDAAAADDDRGFLDRVAARNVLLESCFVCSRELTVSGVVRVKNLAYEKTVIVRYTTDGWSTHRDVPANYVPNSNDGRTDRFVFIVHLPEGFGAEEEEEAEGEKEKEDASSADSGSRGRSLQLAVALRAGGDTFWDNNDGQNYVIDCVMRNREPSISGDSTKTTTDPSGQ